LCSCLAAHFFGSLLTLTPAWIACCRKNRCVHDSYKLFRTLPSNQYLHVKVDLRNCPTLVLTKYSVFLSVNSFKKAGSGPD